MNDNQLSDGDLLAALAQAEVSVALAIEEGKRKIDLLVDGIVSHTTGIIKDGVRVSEGQSSKESIRQALYTILELDPAKFWGAPKVMCCWTLTATDEDMTTRLAIRLPLPFAEALLGRPMTPEEIADDSIPWPEGTYECIG